MAQNYTVQQGDHLSKLAKKFGFSDYHTIWDHPNNADLKQTRQNPNVLYPGDNLFIPDRELRTESRSTDQKHQFKAKKPNLKLRLVLEDMYEKPIAGAKCIVTLGGDSKEITTDGSGRIEEAIPADVHEGTLVIQGDQTPFNNIQIPILVGNLDPVDTISGQIARLNNLGYFAGDPDKPDDDSSSANGGCGCGGPDDTASAVIPPGTNQQFQSALQEFQCDHDLTVDGICGPQTQSALKKAHGC
jgi:N-acetylmuramoyl-L-alanine amidase